MNPINESRKPSQGGGALLSWDEVLDVAKSAFNVWVGQPELQWAKRAWQVLQDANLTRYRTELERYSVLFRLLVLGGIYSDFCDLAWGECSDPPYSNWAGLDERDMPNAVSTTTMGAGALVWLPTVTVMVPVPTGVAEGRMAEISSGVTK